MFNLHEDVHIGNGSVVPDERILANKMQNALLSFIEVCILFILSSSGTETKKISEPMDWVESPWLAVVSRR